LTELIRQVDSDELDMMEESLRAVDLTDLNAIAAVYAMLLSKLVGAKLGPETVAEAREILTAATTLAAARAQGVFSTESPLDGTMALAQAAAAARARHRLEDQTTEEIIEPDEHF